MNIPRSKIFALSLILGGCAIFSGCASDSIPDDAQLPWNRPASWENQRDISTDLSLHKVYGSGNFYKNKGKLGKKKEDFLETQMKAKALRGENNGPMKSKNYKIYEPENFLGGRKSLELKIRDSEMQIKAFRRESDDTMKSKIIHNEPSFFPENNKDFTFDVTKTYPEQSDVYNFKEENSDFLRDIDR
jgi:hypothetical protein